MEDHERSRERVPLNRMVLLTGEQEYGGYIHDISSNGMSVGFVSPEDQENHSFKNGDSITIAIENIGAVSGKVIRVSENGLAVSLDVNSDEEEELIAHIMAAKNKIPIRD